MGVVSKSDSPYNINPQIARKSNGDLRFTLNLIPVNELVVPIQYASTFIEDIHRRGKGKKFKSILDLKDAYWQIILPYAYRWYFAFSITHGPHKGHYEMNCLPQGFCES